MRERTEELIYFYTRDLYRTRQLKKDIAGLCNELDDTKSELRLQCKRNRELENLNNELIEQLSGLSVGLVNATFERDRRSSFATKRSVNATFVALLVVVVAYLCCHNYRA